MTRRPWMHNAGRSALVVVIAGAGMVATAEIRSLEDQRSGTPPVAAGPPLAGPAASSPSSSRSHGRDAQPVVAVTPEPGSGAQLVVKQSAPTVTPEARPSTVRTPPAGTPPSAPAPGSSPTPTPSTAPAPTPVPTHATTACVVNVLGIKVCLGGN